MGWDEVDISISNWETRVWGRENPSAGHKIRSSLTHELDHAILKKEKERLM